MQVARENQLDMPPKDKDVVVVEQRKEEAKVYGPEAILRTGVIGNFEPPAKSLSSGPGNCNSCVDRCVCILCVAVVRWCR